MKLMDRRTMLRGLVAGATVGLGMPILESMLNTSGTALAAGTALPKRFGMFFWGVGAFPATWQPTQVGATYTLPTALQALAPVSKYVNVLSKMNIPSAATGASHYCGQGWMVSGAWDSAGHDEVSSKFGSPGAASVDQQVAKAWKGKTRLDSVVVGVSRAMQADQVPFPSNARHASWLADNTPNYHEFSLKNFYNTLFTSNSVDVHSALQQKSILDVVSSDMATLRARLGTADQGRLDAHAQSVRDIETRLLQFGNGTCAAPSAVADNDGTANHEPLQERSRLFADMIAVALSCDITRVFTMQFTPRETDTVFWQVGATEGQHIMSHSTGTPGYRAILDKILGFTMGEFSYLLQKLAGTPEGAGNVLDNCAIYATSCIGDPAAHSYGGDLMILTAGNAGGSLKSGMHYRGNGQELVTQVPLTLMRSVGVNAANFGAGPLATTTSLPALAP